MAKTESVSAQMKELLDEVDENVKKSTEQNAKDCSKGSATALKSSSPRKSGKYSSGWTTKKLGEADYIVYNREGWETHILENGHAIVNKKGTYGRVPGIKHIKPVEDEFVEKFIQDCMRDKL